LTTTNTSLTILVVFKSNIGLLSRSKKMGSRERKIGSYQQPDHNSLTKTTLAMKNLQPQATRTVGDHTSHGLHQFAAKETVLTSKSHHPTPAYSPAGLWSQPHLP
jgi:hypothetical protein